jgi:hypothetical protein
MRRPRSVRLKSSISYYALDKLDSGAVPCRLWVQQQIGRGNAILLSARCMPLLAEEMHIFLQSIQRCGHLNYN